MKGYMRILWCGMRASWAMYSVELTPVVFLGAKVPRAILQALFFVLLAKAAGGDQLATFALIGNLVHAAAFPAVIFMSNTIEMERWSNTLPYLVASPTHWLPLLIGRSFATFCDALFNSLVVLITLAPFFGPGVALSDGLRALPVFILTICSVSTLGWLIGSISLGIRWGPLLGNSMAYAMMILCSVNTPSQMLPVALGSLGRMLPLTHGLLAIRMILNGSPYSQVAGLIGYELLIGAVYGAVAWVLFGWRLHRVRAAGTLELV